MDTGAYFNLNPSGANVAYRFCYCSHSVATAGSDIECPKNILVKDSINHRCEVIDIEKVTDVLTCIVQNNCFSVAGILYHH